MTTSLPAQRISHTTPRQTIQITINNGLVLEGPIGATVAEFLTVAAEQQTQWEANGLMGGILDGRLRELAYPIQRDGQLEPVWLTHSDGSRIYRRSLVMLLATAIDELWPRTRVSVRYSLPEGAFYCKLLNREPFSTEELSRLDEQMHAICAEDAPISKRSATLEEASALFASREELDKVRLLEHRTRATLTLYKLHDREDYFYGYMLPSTRYLQIFRLARMNSGFVLQYPHKETPHTLPHFNANTKLVKVFRQADEWLDRMQVEDIGQLNRLVHNNKVSELVLVAEALHEQHIAHIAHDISTRHESRGVQMVLIAGPSSSGKTTFSKRLAIQLLAHGLRPFTLELDNYFVNRELTPRDEHGAYDFENIHAINLALFNQHLLRLMSREQVQLPRFDFVSGRSVDGQIAHLKHNEILIIEGIHGLNPRLVPDIPPDKIYRVYVSALTQLNIDSHNRVPTTDVRLIRRIVRDAEHRGYSATDTLQRWSSVRNGEKLNIFPYQENADAMFNSALAYELAALRPLAEPLLLQVEPATPPHIEANRLLSFLRWVQPLSPMQQAMIPDTSLLREFIGGSIQHHYHPGEMHTD